MRAKKSALVAEGGALNFFSLASPGGDGLKIVKDQVIIFYRAFTYITHELDRPQVKKGIQNINASFFPKYEIQPMLSKVDIMQQRHIRLPAAKENMHISIRQQVRDYILCAADVPVTGALYCVKYFHIQKVWYA